MVGKERDYSKNNTEPLTVSTGQLFATIIKYLGEATYKRRRLTVQNLVDPISTAI